MNKKQLQEEYPAGAMVEILPYWHERPPRACYGIIVETEIYGGSARCFVHVTEGRRAYWSIDFLKVVGEVIDKDERQ